jgi:hypothetical protein
MNVTKDQTELLLPILFFGLIGLSSPLVAYIGLLFVFVVFSSRFSAFVGRVGIFFFSINFALIASSRAFFETRSDDLIRYYQNYELLLAGDPSGLLEFGQGFEIVLPLIHSALAGLIGRVEPSGLLFVLVFVQVMLFGAWLQNRGERYHEPEKLGVLVAYGLFFFSILFSTQLIRQTLGLVIVIHAFDRPFKSSWMIVLAATLTHVTSLGIYSLYWITRKKSVWWSLSLVFLISLLVQVGLSEIINSLPVLRRGHFLSHPVPFRDTLHPRNLRILVFCGLAMCFRNRSFVLDEAITFSAMPLFFLAHPQVSLRAGLLAVAVMFGYWLFVLMDRLPDNVGKIAMIGFLLYRFWRFANPFNDDPFRLWASYPWYGPPWYFIGG